MEVLVYKLFNADLFHFYPCGIHWIHNREKERRCFTMEDFYHPSHLSGLTSQQVRRKKGNGKQNIQPEKVTKSTGQIWKDNICTLFNLFNVCIAIALALVGAWSNMLFILIIALNTWIGVVQELHAKKLVNEYTFSL